MILSIDEVQELLEKLCDELPEGLFQQLNGGVLLLEDTVPDPEVGDEVYIMGDYCRNRLGRYVNIYYGSFAALLADAPREEWEEELRITLRHELTHHVEDLAGERGLERWDEEELDRMWQENHSGQTEGEEV